MAKLSAQLQEKKRATQPQRPTRTERVKAQQKAKAKQREHERLKAKAEKIREEQFKPKEVEEEYYVDVPDWDKITWGSYFKRKWGSYSGRQRSRRLEDWKEEGKTKRVKKTRTKEIPFKLEEGKHTYKDIYSGLDPKLQRYFQSPEQIKEKRTEQRKEDIQKTQEEIKKAREKLKEKRERYQKREESYKKRRDWLRGRKEKWSDDPERYERHRERIDERMDKYEDDLEEDEAYYRELIQRLGQGTRKLKGGQNIPFKSVKDWAEEYADYEERRETARNRSKRIKRKYGDEFKELKEETDWKEYKEKYYDLPDVARDFFKSPYSKDVKKGFTDYAQRQRYLEQYGKQGLTPVFKEGTTNIKGFEDKVLGKSYGVGKLFDYTKERRKYNISYDPAKQQISWAQPTKQQDIPIETWQTTTLGKKDLPIGYGGQQSVSTQPVRLTMSTEKYLEQQDQSALKKFGGFVGGVFEPVKKGAGWIDERIHLDLQKGVSFGKIEEPTFYEKASELGQEKIGDYSEALEKWAIGEEKITGFEEGLGTKYQQQYQGAFERKYGEDIRSGDIEFEEAQKRFEEGEEAKTIQELYQQEYGEGYKGLQTDIPFWTGKGAVAGVGQFGLSLGSLGLKATKTPTRIAGTSLAVYSGKAVLGSLPKGVSTGISTGFTTYGTLTALDPTKTYAERGSGLAMAGISGGALAKQGVRYLKSPVTKFKSIKAPRPSVRSTDDIGKDYRLISPQGKVYNKILFQPQKLSQVARAGRRTLVTTKWRDLVSKYTKFQPAPIYRGIPTQQLGKSYSIQGLRGTYRYSTPSAYQKAFKLLKKYGATDYQAKATLRYSAPVVKEQYLRSGVLSIKGGKASGQFKYVTKQPVIDVDKTLGIKTRGARSIKDVMDVQRKAVTFKGKQYVVGDEVSAKFLLNKQGKVINLKDLGSSRVLTAGKTTGFQKGYEVVGGTDDFLLKPSQYKQLYGVSIRRRTWPTIQKLTGEKSRTVLFNKVIDLSKDKNLVKLGKGVGKGGTGFGGGTTSARSLRNIRRIVNKLDDIGTTKTTKAFYSPQETKGGVAPFMKTAPTPPTTKIQSIKNIVETGQTVGTGVSVASLTASAFALSPAVSQRVARKTKTKKASKLKTSQLLRNQLKSRVGLKQKQISQLDKVQKIKTQLIRSPTTRPLSPTLSQPLLRPPKTPTPKTPTRIIGFPSKEIKKLLKEKSMKGMGIKRRAYLPDFTSRAIGLKAQTVTEKQAQKKLKKIMTGLEVRRGFKVT